MDEIQYAFMDEIGDYHFDFDKKVISTHLIIVAVLVKESNIEVIEQEIEKITQKYGQIGELHHDTDGPRLQFLTDIRDLPFSIYAYVIDKRKIREDFGIMDQPPFIKYLNRMIYEDLNRTFEQLDLVADEQDSKLFMQEFKNYIRTKSIPDLFDYSTFGFNNSKSNLLLGESYRGDACNRLRSNTPFRPIPFLYSDL